VVEEVVEAEAGVEGLGQQQLRLPESMISRSTLSSILNKGAADITISVGH